MSPLHPVRAPMNLTSKKALAGSLLAVLVVAGSVWALRGQSPDAQPPTSTTSASAANTGPSSASPGGAKPALTVTTAQPQATALPLGLTANGNIAAWQEAVVGSESNGLRLSEVRAQVGDVVRAGQVLARFADATLLAEVAQAKATLAEAEANAREASLNAERARSLQGTGALSAQQINQYDTTAQTAQARVQAARATLEAQQLRLRQTQVLAPDSGVISARSATVGAVVPSGTELFRLIRQGRLEWRAEVTATELARLPPGTPVRVTAANGTTVRGKVRVQAPTVDVATRSALIYVDLSPAPVAGAAAVKAGMFAKGEFELGTTTALTVPQQAVVVRDGFSHVFRLQPDGRVSQIRVQAGRRVGDRVEVPDGLTADAVVVVSGAGFLNDGDLVKQVPSPSAGAASGPAKE